MVCNHVRRVLCNGFRVWFFTGRLAIWSRGSSVVDSRGEALVARCKSIYVPGLIRGNPWCCLQ